MSPLTDNTHDDNDSDNEENKNNLMYGKPPKP